MHALRAASSTLLRSYNQSAPFLTRASARSRALPRPSAPHPLGPPTPPPRPPSTAAAAAAARAPVGIAAATGLVSGTLGSLCGVGGAVFAIPGLVRFAGLPQRVAAGTSLVAVTAIAGTSAVSFARAGHIDWDVAAVLGGAAALCTPIGARCSQRLDPALLRRGLGGFMLLLAPAMPLRARLEKERRDGGGGGGERGGSPERTMLLGAAGAGVGFLSGLLGISGGSLFTPLIAMVGAEGGFKEVLGTSFAAMIVPTSVGAATYARMGFVSARLVAPVLGGAVVGAGLGSAAALAVPEETLRWTFSVIFMVLGMRVWRAPIKAPPAGKQAAEGLSALEGAARKVAT